MNIRLLNRASRYLKRLDFEKLEKKTLEKLNKKSKELSKPQLSKPKSTEMSQPKKLEKQPQNVESKELILKPTNVISLKKSPKKPSVFTSTKQNPSHSLPKTTESSKKGETTIQKGSYWIGQSLGNGLVTLVERQIEDVISKRRKLKAEKKLESSKKEQNLVETKNHDDETLREPIDVDSAPSFSLDNQPNENLSNDGDDSVLNSQENQPNSHLSNDGDDSELNSQENQVGLALKEKDSREKSVIGEITEKGVSSLVAKWISFVSNLLMLKWKLQLGIFLLANIGWIVYSFL